MLRIIFWNVYKKDLTNFVCAITASTNADIIVLIENIVSNTQTLQALQENVSKDFYLPIASTTSSERFHCFGRNRYSDLSEIHSSSRISVRKLKIGRHNTLLALVHGLDVRNHDIETRQSFVQRLSGEIKFVKDDKSNNKLILLGDFNMNPYDRAMTLPAGMNAMMTKLCIKRGFRKHLGKNHEFYYNPMWSLFGDKTGGPAGTIYDTSNVGSYGWNMFDQVIINHSIVELFNDVKILTEAGTESLMDKNGRPDKNKASDHFPILVEFSESNNE